MIDVGGISISYGDFHFIGFIIRIAKAKISKLGRFKIFELGPVVESGKGNLQLSIVLAYE